MMSCERAEAESSVVKIRRLEGHVSMTGADVDAIHVAFLDVDELNAKRVSLPEG